MSNFENAKVLVKQGWLQGYIDGNLKIFKGVPYAAPPVGELRWRHPQDPENWRGVRRAVEYSAAAIQHVREQPNMPANVHGVPQNLARSQYEEDCLYLNIWTPAKAETDKLPVFVWIHGGGMVAGSGVECVCDGDGFAKRKDIVVVTINYRLGFYGFFAHPELTAEGNGTSGNYAFYDMRKACLWLKENIAQFGGDPDNITVAGQSGGAAATGSLHVSPMMKGIIKRVSIESGPIYWGFQQPVHREILEERGVEFMKSVGCKNIAELRQRDAWELFDAYEQQGREFGFSMCIDGEFIPAPYKEMMDAGNFNDFDVLMGSCSQEFASAPNGISVADYYKYLEESFPDNAENMKKWYPAATDDEAAKQATTISSDIMLMGAVRIGQLCNQYGRKAYIWRMVKETEDERGRKAGSPHCAEMVYVFGRVDKGGRSPFSDYHWVGADYDFMEEIQNYWYNFALTGDPNSAATPEWKPYTEDFAINELGNDTHMITDPEMQAKYAYYFKKLMALPGEAPVSVQMRGLAKLL